MPRWLIILLAIIGGLTLTCGSTLLVGFLWLATSSGPPPGISVSIVQPPEIRVGDTFDIVITVTESLGQTRTIRDVDFYDPLLEGVSIVKVDPPYSASNTMFASTTFTMEAPIAPGASTVLTFTFKAEVAGVYRGDLDVGVDKITTFDTTPFTLVIGAKKE